MKIEKSPGVFSTRLETNVLNKIRPSSSRVSLFRHKVLIWYYQSGRIFPWRQADADLYVQILVEILLQRTRAETVATFLPTFLRRYPCWDTIAAANINTLSDALRPLGLWRHRAPSLLQLAKEITCLDHEWPKEKSVLEAMPAIGQYVANAVLLFAHGQREPLLDASMARLLRRYFGLQPIMADLRHDKLLNAVAHSVLQKCTPIELNWAMLDIASIYCKQKETHCSECPLNCSCQYKKASQQRAGILI